MEVASNGGGDGDGNAIVVGEGEDAVDPVDGEAVDEVEDEGEVDDPARVDETGQFYGEILGKFNAWLAGDDSYVPVEVTHWPDEGPLDENEPDLWPPEEAEGTDGPVNNKLYLATVQTSAARRSLADILTSIE